MSTFAQWPEIVKQAFFDTWLFEYAYMDKVDHFAQRWGGLDHPAFLRALAQGQDKERCFAMFALAHTIEPGIKELLFPFLGSEQREEQWASAISLGRLKDERVFPVLLKLLLESLQDYPMTVMLDDTYALYHHHRCSIVKLLGAWASARAVPALRQALQTLWQFEQQPGPRDGRWGDGIDDLHLLEDNIAYALGQLEAWGALSGLDLSPSHLYWMMEYMILGHLGIRLTDWSNVLGSYIYDENISHVFGTLEDTVVVESQQVKMALTRYFGLTEEEHVTFFHQLANKLAERDEEAIKK